MKWLNGYRIRLVWVGVMAAIVFGNGSAKADFTFGKPMNLVSPVNSAHSEYFPSLSADGVSLYFGSNRPGGEGGYDIWVTTRETKDDKWGTPMNLGAPVNSSNDESAPNISADGLSIYFISLQGGEGGHDIWVSTRETVDAPWSEPVNLGPPVNTPRDEIRPAISADGLSLYFSDHSDARPGGYGEADLWVTMRETVDALWNEPVNLGPIVNSSCFDARPCISSDDLVLLFDSHNRDGGYGRIDLYMTKRASPSDPWGTPVNIGPPVNSPIPEENPSISPDGSTLYFCSPDRPGGYGDYDLWQAKVIAIVDLNGDGIVDVADMCIMVDHWGENHSLCDIGPMPLGDGVVDIEDLKVLAEHLFEEVTDPTLIAHWLLDEAQGGVAYNNAADCDGTLIGGPVWQPDGGAVDGALQFDGIDDYVSTDFVLNPADGKFSVVAWIKDGAPGQVVLSQADGLDWLCMDSVDGHLMTELTNSGRSSVGPMLSQANITDGNWHRIGFVWDGSYRHLYLDGIEVAKDAEPLSGLESAEGGLHFGTGSNLASGTFFSGLIDDVRIYNRAVQP